MAKVSVKDLSLVQIYTKEGARGRINRLAKQFDGVVYEKNFTESPADSGVVLNAWVPKDKEAGFFTKVSGKYDAQVVPSSNFHKDLKTIDMSIDMS